MFFQGRAIALAIDASWKACSAGPPRQRKRRSCRGFATARRLPPRRLTAPGGACAHCIACPLLSVSGIPHSDWCKSTSPFKPQRDVSIELELEVREGRDTGYTLLPSTFEPGEEAGFLIRVYSDHPCELARL